MRGRQCHTPQFFIVQQQLLTFRVCFSQPGLYNRQVGRAFAFSIAGIPQNLSTFCPSRTAGWETYSLKRRLWILVMAFEAMGLPMPELAGEPWETGVML